MEDRVLETPYSWLFVEPFLEETPLQSLEPDASLHLAVKPITAQSVGIVTCYQSYYSYPTF